MLRNVATNTNVIFYLMAVIGVLGVLAKLVNHLTLRRLVKAAGNMPKSTHKLIKLVRAKYEHACMIHDSVENIDAFVEKYIYEYRGFLFRIHTWRQIELLSVWFSESWRRWERRLTTFLSDLQNPFINILRREWRKWSCCLL